MKKIYLLEDSKVVTELLRFDLVNEFNCEVITFDNGNDLIKNLPSSPDVIILDHFIDNEFQENGLVILNRIKAINKVIPVIMFTGQHDLKLAVNLIHAGAIDYIDKNDDSFLENMNTSIRNIFKYEDTVIKLNKIQKRLLIDKKQILGLVMFCLVLLTTLYILQKLNVHFQF
jgi:DNA-binding NtrC family response regulator